jgi:hypothetical protein
LRRSAGNQSKFALSDLTKRVPKEVKFAQETVPQNVPQRYANQALHARTVFPSDFVSIENKGSKIQIPKLDVAGSIPVARSIFPVKSRSPCVLSP